MKTSIRRIFAASALLVFSATANGAGPYPGSPNSFADLTEKLAPAVVNVSTTQIVERKGGAPDVEPGDPFEEWFREFGPRDGDSDKPRRRRQSSLGSGFIIDRTGYVVTNNHVIDQADKVSVILADDSVHDAKVVGRDPKTDVALLKIDAKRDLPTVPWGNSDKTRVGDWVLAIGNPFGLGGTVTAGIISARSRDIDEGNYDDFFQTDAAINRGNSGGPLFNMNGEVIGINTSILSATGASVGVGFASASNLVAPILEDLRKYGRTRRGWVGIQIQTVNGDTADGLGLREAKGALVSGVSPKSPAELGGIQSGDVILSFDGKPIDKMRTLPRLVAVTPIDKVADVEVWRKGKTIIAKVKVGELKEDLPKPVAQVDGDLRKELPRVGLDALGITVAEINERVRKRFNIADGVGGLVVVEIKDNSDAADKGLKRGDVIDEIAQAPVATAYDAVTALKKAAGDGRKTVLLRVQSGENIRFIGVKLNG